MGTHAENIGYRIKVCRERLGLTQVQLGGIIGVHGSTFSPIENGRYLPGSKMAAALAKVFNISVDELMEDKDEVMSAEALSAPFEKPVLQVSPEFSARVEGFPEKLPVGPQSTGVMISPSLERECAESAKLINEECKKQFEFYKEFKDILDFSPQDRMFIKMIIMRLMNKGG